MYDIAAKGAYRRYIHSGHTERSKLIFLHQKELYKTVADVAFVELLCRHSSVAL